MEERREEDSSSEARPLQLRTGSEQPVDPEDLVRLSGRDLTPERIERARRLLEEQGPAAVEKYLP